MRENLWLHNFFLLFLPPGTPATLPFLGLSFGILQGAFFSTAFSSSSLERPLPFTILVFFLFLDLLPFDNGAHSSSVTFSSL